MNTMHFVAFVVGLVALTRADVSHLKQSGFALNSLSNNEHSRVSSKFNNAGNVKNTNSRYWWMNTESSPFTRTENNYEENQIYNTLQSVADAGASHQKHEAQYVQSIPCYGSTQVCAPKDACDNGFIRERNLGLVLNQANNCDSQVASCCNILPDAAPQSHQSSQPCSDANSACVSSNYCRNGFIDQSVEHQAVRSTNGFCNPPDICCRYSDRKRQAPAFRDSSFAAASTSEVLTKEGYVVRVPSNQYLPGLPEPEFAYNPDASNDDPSRIKPDIPVYKPPQQPAYQPPQQPAYQPPQQPAYKPPQQPAYQPPQQPAYQPPQQPAYQPPQQPAYQPPQQPAYQPPQQPAYRPPQQPYQPQPNPQRPYQPQANNPRPSVVLQDQALSLIPTACAAALNCTLIEYCSATAVISKTPVVLTDFQQENRVPMTDCLIMPSRELGKCCRDPDYTDPWPIGRLGQYNAEELNGVFDSGAYKP